MEEKVLLKIYESINQGKPVAMAVITEEIGSSPRKSGTMMAVWEDGHIFGTVGGGKIELTIIEKAITCIENNENDTFEYHLTEKGLGMQCGGTVRGYIKVFYPKTRLFIVGAGHIGEKLNQLAKVIDFYTIVIDERKEYANTERFPNADEIIVNDVGKAIDEYEMNENDYVVLVTKSHLNDKDALKAVINKKHAYIGMIGSTKKVRYNMELLIQEGISEEKLRKVYSPIGLNITSNEPHEIAFGILSEILLVKNNGTLNHRKDLKKVWQ